MTGKILVLASLSSLYLPLFISQIICLRANLSIQEQVKKVHTVLVPYTNTQHLQCCIDLMEKNVVLIEDVISRDVYQMLAYNLT